MLIKNARFLILMSCLAFSHVSYAKVFLNSMCSLNAAAKTTTATGDNNKLKKYPLASISKIATALWALDVYGGDFRFKTKIHVTPAGSKQSDVHIEGSRFPFMGQKMGYLLISELNKIGVTNIRKLTFDENFLLSWNIEVPIVAYGVTPVYKTYEEQADFTFSQINTTLLTAIQRNEYAAVRKSAAGMKLEMVSNPQLNAKEVYFQSSQAFKSVSETKSFTFASAPLSSILKQMNNQSNNYIADNLFMNLGGTAKFNEYISKKLAVTAKDFVFVNGSGNNDGTTAAPIYNQASCQFMIQVMVALDKTAANNKLKLTDILAVSGVDSESTVMGFNGNLQGAAAIKTGSVNKAKTLSGAIMTKQGLVYFAILYHTDRDINAADWGVANTKIKEKLSQLAKKSGGATKLDYEEIDTQPFDSKSAFELLTLPKLNAKLQ